MIGTPRMIAIREHRFPFLLKVQNWNRFNANSGGTFVEKCCHFFDLMCRINSGSKPICVYSTASQSCNHLNEIYAKKNTFNGSSGTPDMIDNGFVLVDFD